jgi:hypothetical protein
MTELISISSSLTKLQNSSPWYAEWAAEWLCSADQLFQHMKIQQLW